MAVALAFPWSGHAWGPASSATGILGGGAATPVPPGTGFNWASIVQAKIGGPVSGYIQNYRGVPVNATFVKRYRGLRGLGQDTTGDPLPTGGDSLPAGSSAPTSTAPWIAPNIYSTPPITGGINWNQFLNTLATSGAKIGQQFASYASPIYNPGTYYQQTPYGSTLITAGGTTPTSATTSSMMPLLLVGGGLLLVMMMARR